MNLKALYKISYGMYIISSYKGDKSNAQIANTVFQITSEIPTVAVSINKTNLTHEYISQSGIFAVSVLREETPLSFIGNFGFTSGKDIDKFKNIKSKKGVSGADIVLDNAIAFIEAQVIDSIDVSTHTVFIGKIINAEVLSEEEPMTYSFYHRVKRGATPRSAPTFIKERTNIGEKKMVKFVCKVCGYVYDPAKGDPESNIQPGTTFEDLPADWICPVCGAPKNQFEEYSE